MLLRVKDKSSQRQKDGYRSNQCENHPLRAAPRPSLLSKSNGYRNSETNNLDEERRQTEKNQSELREVFAAAVGERIPNERQQRTAKKQR
jgi:hypothetical protein